MRTLIFFCAFFFLAIISKGQTIEWKWGRGGGGSGNDTGKIVALDSKRNYVYVLGGTNSSSITIGAQTLIGPAATSYFIAKYDTAGNFKWAKRFLGYASGLDCDTISGSVYITGTGGHFFLQKLDSLGTQQWGLGPTVTSTYPAPTYGSDVVVLSNGDVVLAGWWDNDYYTDVLHIGGFNLTNNLRGRFVVKVSPTGNVLNAVISGGHNSMWYDFQNQDYRNIFKLEKDNLDNIFVAWNRTTRDLYPAGDACYSIVPNINPPLSYTTFTIKKYNASLNQQTTYCFSGTGTSCSPWFHDRWFNDITRDVNGDLYVSFSHGWWNGATGLGSACSGSGTGLFRLPNGSLYYDTVRYNQMSIGPITIFNGLVSFYTEYPAPGPLRVLDFESNQEISSGSIPFVSKDAIAFPGTRKNLVTGLYTQNATVGPDILPSLTGENFVLGATNSNCPTGPRNLRTNKAPSLCSNDSVFIIAPAGFNFLWNTGATTKSIKVNTAGSYSATLSLPGCPDLLTDTVVVSVNQAPPVPIITASGPLSFCAGDSVILSGPPGYSYLWNNGATSQSITVKTIGNYSLRLSNPNGCSASSGFINVTVYPVTTIPTISGGNGSYCQGDNVTLVANQGTYFGFSYLWSNGATGQSISVNTSGTYTVTATSLNGCGVPQTSLPKTVTINPNPPPPVISASGPTSFCNGGSVTLTAPSGYSYNWGNNITTQSITATTSGFYRVTIRDANNCSSNSTTTVTVMNPPPVPVISTMYTTICEGDSTYISINNLTSNTQILWNTGAATSFIWAKTTGDYYVTLSSPLNCGPPQTSNIIHVTVNPRPVVPVITSNGPTTFCQGQSITLTAPPGYNTYSWSTGQATQSIFVNSANNYFVWVTNSFGCWVRSATVPVTVLPAITTPIITANGPTSFCPGGSVTLSAPAGYTYLWNTGATTQSIVASSAGNYNVTIYNSCGQQATSANRTVTVYPPPIITILPTTPVTICEGSSVGLTATGGSSPLWSTGATTTSINVSIGGLYTVTMTGSNGCTGTGSKTVIVNPYPPQPVITAGGPISFCIGGSVTLSAPPGYNYLWNTGQTSQSIVVSTTGNYYVRVGNGSCYSNPSTPVFVTASAFPAIPIITANGSTSFCQGGSITLTAPSAASWLWNTGASTQTLLVNSSGNYSVTVTNAIGCSSTSSVFPVTVNPLPPVPVVTTSGPTSFCLGGSVTLTAPPGYSYTWSNGSTSQSIGVSAANNYSVIITDNNNCSSTSALTTVNVNLPPPVPIISASGPTLFCQGGSVDLSAPAGYSYLWSNGSTTQTVNITSAGNYSVTISNANGCTSTSVPTTVAVHPQPAVPTITASGPTSFCAGGSVTLSAPAGFSYLWSNGSTSQSINVNTSGNYSVTVTNNNNCNSTSVPVTVTVHPLPPVPVITQNGNVLTSTPATTYQWYFNGSIIPGATSQNYTYSTGGDYTVSVTNAQGCSATSVIYTVMRNEFVLLGDSERFYMTLFPNPVTGGQLTVQYEIEQPHRVAVRLINMQGRSITVQSEIQRTSGRYTINANAVAERIWPGVYVLEFRIDGKKVAKTIIKL